MGILNVFFYKANTILFWIRQYTPVYFLFFPLAEFRSYFKGQKKKMWQTVNKIEQVELGIERKL